MGYQRAKRIYVIRDWPEEDMAGLEVKARSVTTGELLEFGRLMTGAQEAGAAEAETVMVGLIDFFAAKLVSWNIEDDDGAPVPATREGLLGQDSDFTNRIIATWMQIVGGVPGPLGTGSTGGGTSLAASLPMVPLSPSQAS